MQSGIDTLNEDQFSPDDKGEQSDGINTWIEIALLWIAVVVVILCWR